MLCLSSSTLRYPSLRLLCSRVRCVSSHTFVSLRSFAGYHLMGVGFAGVFFVPSARIWGKRHLYLLGTVLVCLTSLWGGFSKSYKSILWARILQGVGLVRFMFSFRPTNVRKAPFEALVGATVGDLYFVHVSHFDASWCSCSCSLGARKTHGCSHRSSLRLCILLSGHCW